MGYIEIIKETGSIIEGKNFRVFDTPCINTSRIFSFLIKEVGTKVSAYQSDLFYDLCEISESIRNMESNVFEIGLRELGVDGGDFCCCRDSEEYIERFRVLLFFDRIENTIELTLSKLV